MFSRDVRRQGKHLNHFGFSLSEFRMGSISSSPRGFDKMALLSGVLGSLLYSPMFRVPHLVVAAASFASAVFAASPDVVGFVGKNCAACHNSQVKSGDLDLKSLTAADTFDKDREIWE